MAFTRRFQSAIAQSVIAGTLLVSVVACAPTPTREGTGEYIDDSVITGKVKAAFAADPTVKATQVQVETFKGTVRESAQRAVELARGVKGVKSVKNDTVIR